MFKIEFKIVSSEYDDFVGQNGFLLKFSAMISRMERFLVKGTTDHIVKHGGNFRNQTFDDLIKRKKKR